ncbi:MarR family winged helix-turn-helix transcriptional regulator [Methanobrevibacter sp.]|uniref:MarR family winged helix-turn-helix transcriptional regulator n=1 Tax=Methanobrevibacter sp. TaxID=66852 RepID=UPI0038908C1E
MTLEELTDIDVSTFPVGRLISMIAKSQQIYLNHNLKEFGINSSQLHLLFEISNQSNINQEKIAKRCNINKGAVARSIKKLEDNELIVREIDEANRRQNKISLTPKGKSILDDSIKILNKWESEVFKDYTKEHKLLLNESLKDIFVNAMEFNNGEAGNE